MAIHHLKTWPSYFQAIDRGEKTFEVRRNDRDYQPGDTLILQEWDPRKGEGVYTGQWLAFKAGWIVFGGDEEFGADAISPLYCVIGLMPHPTLTPAAVPPIAPGALGPAVRLVDGLHPDVARRLGLEPDTLTEAAE
jgi:hypothetical protein